MSPLVTSGGSLRESRFAELLDCKVFARTGIVSRFWSLLGLFFWQEDIECFLALGGGRSSLRILSYLVLDLDFGLRLICDGDLLFTTARSARQKGRGQHAAIKVRMEGWTNQSKVGKLKLFCDWLQNRGQAGTREFTVVQCSCVK